MAEMSGLPKFVTHAGEWALLRKYWYYDLLYDRYDDPFDGIARIWFR